MTPVSLILSSVGRISWPRAGPAASSTAQIATPDLLDKIIAFAPTPTGTRSWDTDPKSLVRVAGNSRPHTLELAYRIPYPTQDRSFPIDVVTETVTVDAHQRSAVGADVTVSNVIARHDDDVRLALGARRPGDQSADERQYGGRSALPQPVDELHGARKEYKQTVGARRIGPWSNADDPRLVVPSTPEMGVSRGVGRHADDPAGGGLESTRSPKPISCR